MTLRITAAILGTLLTGSTMAASTPAVAPAAPAIQGDYVEARTASVFAGACHYNGELVTIGHEAVAAWDITAGSWHGVNLAGVRAVAAISSDGNLGDAQGTRECVLMVDSAASTEQVKAFADWVGTHRGTLGQVAAVRRGSVQFVHAGSTYTVVADGFAAMNVQGMPNDECCKQPNLVWYSPLMKLEHRKVGYTVSASYVGDAAAEPWQRGDENSAFYGRFAE